MKLEEAVEILGKLTRYPVSLQSMFVLDKEEHQALQTVLAAVKRANLTDEELGDLMPQTDKDTSMQRYIVAGHYMGARHVRDLLRGEVQP